MALRNPIHFNIPLTALFMLVCAMCASPASAQHYPCPSGPGYGERIVAMEGQLPLCEAVDQGPAAQAPDPREAVVADMVEFSRGLTQSLNYGLQQYAEFANAQSRLGGWQFSSPGQSCSATFYSSDGFIRIDGPGRTMARPMLTFYSPLVAKPSGHKVVDVTLENGPPAPAPMSPLPVKGLNWSGGSGKGGVISLQIATAPTLIRGIDDRQRFKLSLKGKTVVDLTWRDGEAAKAQLKKCMGV